MTDTIFARATAAGRAGVAIVRISGPTAGPVLERMAGALPQARRAVLRPIVGPSGDLIDRALVLWMPGPESFTGEDCAELHIHGGPAVYDGVSEALLAHNARQAEPGEFSRRAFTNGRLDLLEAEAIADLVEAETTAQRRQALAQMSGEVGRRYEGWRSQLLDALAFIEAENDFPDEDLPGALARRAEPLIGDVLAQLKAAAAGADRGRRVREGYRIALVGKPNAGKSSLLNALLGRDAAIVSPRPGTTRDVIEAAIVVEGYSAILGDTAGLRRTRDEVETEGVARARRWAEAAAWRWVLVDPSDSADLDDVTTLIRPGDLLLLTKSDQASDVPVPTSLSAWADRAGLLVLRSSTITAAGLDQLRRTLSKRLVHDLGSSQPVIASRARHVEGLGSAIAALEQALPGLTAAPERAAEDVRAAMSALKAIVGDLDREAVLDRVFSSFCIGK